MKKKIWIVVGIVAVVVVAYLLLSGGKPRLCRERDVSVYQGS